MSLDYTHQSDACLLDMAEDNGKELAKIDLNIQSAQPSQGKYHCALVAK